MKRCSTSLIIREMHIKIIIRYHFTPVSMAIVKKSTNNIARKGVQKRETSHIFGGFELWNSNFPYPLWSKHLSKEWGLSCCFLNLHFLSYSLLKSCMENVNELSFTGPLLLLLSQIYTHMNIPQVS